jgi:hypothetical protein
LHPYFRSSGIRSINQRAKTLVHELSHKLTQDMREQDGHPAIKYAEEKLIVFSPCQGRSPESAASRAGDGCHRRRGEAAVAGAASTGFVRLSAIGWRVSGWSLRSPHRRPGLPWNPIALADLEHGNGMLRNWSQGASSDDGRY